MNLLPVGTRVTVRSVQGSWKGGIQGHAVVTERNQVRTLYVVLPMNNFGYAERGALIDGCEVSISAVLVHPDNVVI